MTAEKPERRTKVGGGTAEGTSSARQTLPACHDHTEHSVTVTMEEVLSRFAPVFGLGLLEPDDACRTASAGFGFGALVVVAMKVVHSERG